MKWAFSALFSPSILESGWLGTYLLRSMGCSSVTVYGVGTEPNARDGSTAWHYWQELHTYLHTNVYARSREFGDNPHHSWDLEHDMLKTMQVCRA